MMMIYFGMLSLRSARFWLGMPKAVEKQSAREARAMFLVYIYIYIGVYFIRAKDSYSPGPPWKVFGEHRAL